MRSASGMSSGLGGMDDFGRGSAQSQQQQSGGFGGMNDPFGRSGSGFGTQSGYGQVSMAGQEDSLKPFSDVKGGPSPALGQPGGRPGSATNSAGASAQSGLPPPQRQQSGFGGGYPGFNQGQYGLGGLGTQQHGQGGYGAYNASSFNQGTLNGVQYPSTTINAATARRASSQFVLDNALDNLNLKNLDVFTNSRAIKINFDSNKTAVFNFYGGCCKVVSCLY